MRSMFGIALVKLPQKYFSKNEILLLPFIFSAHRTEFCFETINFMVKWWHVIYDKGETGYLVQMLFIP